MELPKIGDNCGVEMCKQLDFLSIKCILCLKIYCKLHNLPHQHKCVDSNTSKIPTEHETSQQLRYVCSLSTCDDWELAPIECPHCLKNFCLKHRHQVDHCCSKYAPQSNPMAEAAAKIQNLTDQLSSEPKRTKKPKNEKLAAKVQLMKLKGKAIGSKELPVEERLFFSVSLPKKFASKEINPMAVFVSHHWSIGRVLDAIAEIAKVPNHNNEEKSPHLVLYRAADGSPLKRFDTSMKELLNEERIYNGQTLILEYGEKGVDSLDQFDTYKK